MLFDLLIFIFAYCIIVFFHEIGHLITMKTDDENATIKLDKKGLRTVGLVSDRTLFWAAANGVAYGWFAILFFSYIVSPFIYLVLITSYLFGIRGDIKVMKQLKRKGLKL